MNLATQAIKIKTENLSSINISTNYLLGWNPMLKLGNDDNSGRGYSADFLAESEDSVIIYAISRCEDDIKEDRLLTIDEVFGKLGV